VEGSAGKRTFGPEKRQLAEIGQQKTLALPKRGSPVHTLIEFVLRLRLDEGIAGKALFVEKERFGVVFVPQRRRACRGDPRRRGWLADVL
jgi:hypothetical protein